MQEVIYFIIVIAILVFVHELGHFIAAKLTGMRTEAFSIGFGKRVIGWSKSKGLSLDHFLKISILKGVPIIASAGCHLADMLKYPGWLMKVLIPNIRRVNQNLTNSDQNQLLQRFL
ncbi:MAG: site-2 protease family protein [Ignavibacteriales bacterium]|nr:site-2 protease family protein [Ignavibacteriales bacterium]